MIDGDAIYRCHYVFAVSRLLRSSASPFHADGILSARSVKAKNEFAAITTYGVIFSFLAAHVVDVDTQSAPIRITSQLGPPIFGQA